MQEIGVNLLTASKPVEIDTKILEKARQVLLPFASIIVQVDSLVQILSAYFPSNLSIYKFH